MIKRTFICSRCFTGPRARHANAADARPNISIPHTAAMPLRRFYNNKQIIV